MWSPALSPACRRVSFLPRAHAPSSPLVLQVAELFELISNLIDRQWVPAIEAKGDLVK